MDHGPAPSPSVYGLVDSVHGVFFRKIIQLVIDFPWDIAIKPLTFLENNPQFNSFIDSTPRPL
jgi:hypothetical protein